MILEGQANIKFNRQADTIFVKLHMLPILNLPPIQPRLQESNGKVWIFDGIRKKFIVLTPEEWVRQHFINYLIIEKYPRSLIKVEGGLSVNELRKRSDVVIYNREGKPWMIVECKNPFVKIDESTIWQVQIYNKGLGARYLVVTNGMQTFFWEVRDDNGNLEQLNQLPLFPN